MQEVPDGMQAAEVGQQDGVDVQTGKAAVSMSQLRSSDTSGISRRTAFTCAILSGVNSTPDSRETVMARGLTDSGPAPSNIASSTATRINGSNGNGSSTADGAGFATNEGNQASAHGSGVSSAAPPSCMAASGVLQDVSLAVQCQTAIPQSAGS